MRGSQDNVSRSVIRLSELVSGVRVSETYLYAGLLVLEFQDSGSGFWGFGSRFQIMGFENSVFGVQYPVSDLRVSVFGIRFPFFGFQYSGFSFRVPRFRVRPPCGHSCRRSWPPASARAARGAAPDRGLVG